MMLQADCAAVQTRMRHRAGDMARVRTRQAPPAVAQPRAHQLKHVVAITIKGP